MAYLKGGTVVDGNLYVEGGLRVKQIIDSSGKKMPHLQDDTSSVGGRIVKFTDANAAIRYSLIEEEYTDADGGTEKISFKDVPTDSEPVSNVLLSMKNVQFFSIKKESNKYNSYLGGTSNLNKLSINFDSVTLNTSTDNIVIGNQGTKKLVGLKKDNYGSILVNGVTYKELTTAQYITEIPDIFIYKVPASSNA